MNRGCVPSPKPMECWKGLPPSSQPTTVARRLVSTKQIKRRPGASPLLFSEFLMSLAAFVSLEDISAELPPYTEQVIGVPMDASLQAAYQALEEQIKAAIKEHHLNHSVISVD